LSSDNISDFFVTFDTYDDDDDDDDMRMMTLIVTTWFYYVTVDTSVCT